MNNAQPDKQRRKMETLKGVEKIPAAPGGSSLSPLPADSGTPPGAENPPASQLTPEEQMALYEKELKENDWGHQPC